MQVTATGEATALAHIITAVQRAQSSRANIQRLGDRVSNVFVPVVCLIALGTAVWWGFAYDSATHVAKVLGTFLWHAHPPDSPLAAAVIAAAAVLIVACPCAMGLATPAAIMAAANAAARRGILIRDGVALEKAGLITAIVLDKTGTLTTGELAVAGPWTPAGTDAARSLAQSLAGSLSRASNHPVSKVLATFGGDVPVENWKETPGAGVEARVTLPNHGQELARLGSLPWLQANGVRMSKAGGDAGAPPDSQIGQWRDEGDTLVGLASGTTLLGVFALRDSLKPNASEIVARLQRRGLKTFLLTGDNPQVAAAVARHAGIPGENVFAEVRPEQKADFIKQLQSRGERVAFVGDGINDAPALTQADLGIAVSRASDVAREAADIILLKTDLAGVTESLGLAQATLRTIKQNLFWAFFYNAAAIPLAALGFMSPVLCAAAMGLSDLVVIGNALRLRNWKS
jgi:Cu+-exporting ATPase